MTIDITKDYVITKGTQGGRAGFIVLRRIPPQAPLGGENNWRVIHCNDGETVLSMPPSNVWTWPNYYALKLINIFHIEYDTEEDAFNAFNLLRSME
jgi:hypothetical protein